MTSRLLVAALVVLALLASGAGDAADLAPVGTIAPEIAPGPWINSPPLTMAGLRGRVVLVEFWTYG
jgi:hypothetical protein